MIRVVIVHEIHLMCEIIAASFKDDPTIQVIGCATNLEEAKAKGPQSDVILVSGALPNKGALAVTQAFKSTPSKVVVLGLPESESAIIQFIEAGAVGYVCKQNSADELIETIHAVHQGKARISPDVAAALIARMAELADWVKHNNSSLDDHARRPNLTGREYQVLALIAQGWSNQEIAQRLTIELGTVKNHVHNILKKLNVSSRAEAAACLPWVETRPTGGQPSERQTHSLFSRPAPLSRSDELASIDASYEDASSSDASPKWEQNVESTNYESWARVPMPVA